VKKILVSSESDWDLGIIYVEDDGFGDHPSNEELRALGATEETLRLVDRYRAACEAVSAAVQEWVDKRPDIDPDVEMVQAGYPAFDELATQVHRALARDLGDRALVTLHL
jgi:hypothetical protein